jgi:AraC family L-rhamnose operon regulatory protein RhaS
MQHSNEALKSNFSIGGAGSSFLATTFQTQFNRSLPVLNDELVKHPKKVFMPEFGVAAYESRHAMGFVGDVQEKHAQFYLVISGKGRWDGGNCSFRLERNCLLHVPAQVRILQEDDPSEPITAFGIHYQPHVLPQFLSDEMRRLGPYYWPLDTYHEKTAQEVRSIFQEMLFEQRSQTEGWEFMVCSQLVDLAVRTLRLARRRSGNSEPMFIRGRDSSERVANYALGLKKRFYRQETLDEAARCTCLSRRQFTQVFRRITGLSWHQFVLRERLNHARDLILHSDKSIVAIAFESGFEELSGFYRLFKRAFGSSPSALRQKGQREGN